MSNFLKAIKIYELIKENDKIAICMSGGKDSFLMAMLFKELKNRNPYIESNIFKSSQNVQLDTLLSYKTNNIKHSFLENFDK